MPIEARCRLEPSATGSPGKPRSRRAVRGHDIPERIVGLAAAGIDGNREEWTAAMRAELASITDRRQRRRFAVGCAIASLRTATRRAVWLTALAAGTVVAAGTFVASRVSLAGGKGGIIGVMLLPTVLVLFGVAFLASTTRSFRIGLTAGGLCLVATLVAWLTVSMVEGAHWYHHVAGVYILDGDAPKGFPFDLRGAVLDPLGFVIPHLVLWVPWPVLSAAAGARITRPKREEARSPTSSMV